MISQYATKTLSVKGFSIVSMGIEQTSKVLAANLRQLKDKHKLKSGYDVERMTGVSKAQVNNLLAEKHSATVETLARLSDGFKIPVWALLHPDGVNIYKDPMLEQVVTAYVAADDSSRAVILSVAESQARFSKD